MQKLNITKIKSEQWEFYKELKLKSLLTDPIAFAAKYEQAVVFSDNEWKKKLAKEESILLFAKYGEKFVGMISAHTKDNGEKTGTATITGVYVYPTYQGLGIGKLLMKRILDAVKNNKEIVDVKIYVSETQVPAIALYKSFGFKLIGKNKNEIYFEDKNFDELIMEKKYE